MLLAHPATISGLIEHFLLPITPGITTSTLTNLRHFLCLIFCGEIIVVRPKVLTKKKNIRQIYQTSKAIPLKTKTQTFTLSRNCQEPCGCNDLNVIFHNSDRDRSFQNKSKLCGSAFSKGAIIFFS